METRLLGQDLTVSAMGLGCMGLSTSRGAEPVPVHEAINLIAKAVDLGVTLFDTAEVITWPLSARGRTVFPSKFLYEPGHL